MILKSNALNDTEILEAAIQNIIDHLPAHIYWKDVNGKYLGCNDLQAKSLNLESKMSIIGKTDFELPWPEGFAEEFRKNDIEVMRRDETKITEEPSTMDGKSVTVLSQKVVLKNKAEKIIGVLGISLDITDRKEKEQLIIEGKVHKTAKTEQEKFRKDVRQMIHDITTPLSSINNFVNNLGRDIPENTRVSLRQASDRIAGISQRLLSKYNGNNTDQTEQVFLASLALMEIVNERREDHRNTGVEIKLHIEPIATFACIKHNMDSIKRMMSNLIKNAVEALKYVKNSRVTVELRANAKRIFIIVNDNGSGMPEHVKDKVIQGIEVTDGKGMMGHGLGLTQVIDTINIGHGTYSIDIKDGTTWDIWFPRVEMPTWVVSEIKLSHDDLIIILDDDDSIHESWNHIFKDALINNKKLSLKHFKEGAEVIKYINGLSSEEKEKLFLLTDQELLDQKLSGLDVVAQVKLARSILVTSYSDNLKIQNDVIKLGIQILPKELVGFVKIHVGKEIIKWSNNADMVWLEDKIWYANNLIKKHYSYLKVETYTNPFVFLEEVRQYPLTTRFILDTHYETAPPESKLFQIDGFQIAEKLYEMGYSSIIVYVSEEPEDEVPNYIKIVPKNDRELMAKLDKI